MIILELKEFKFIYIFIYSFNQQLFILHLGTPWGGENNRVEFNKFSPRFLEAYYDLMAV